MELLAGLEPATLTYDHPSADAAPGTPVSKRRALPVELQERKGNLEHRTGFEPVSQRWQRRVLNQLDQRCVFGRGGQN